MFAPSDQRLVKQALINNKKAWLQLISRYERLVYNYALRMVGNREDALDLMQDVFLSVFRNLATWRGESSFKNWLMSIAHYRCIEHYRRRKFATDDSEVADQASDDDWHNPEQVYAGQQRGMQLFRAMQKLPLDQRLVVELKFFQHMHLADIAQQLEIPLSTVKSRLYGAVSKLQEWVEVV
ncbi:RNA polymerase sigma factor [Pseudidiomarina donghaiensis]|uniref:Sigma-70 family RNA polymerase sigma factor n=1 Tax=Pseudidiomarina donghaiensis TaxID=519452 RepID=A0A432XFR5_9GAMM|nr:sigma-70 family RNA polymerase sigma factor [Pseudidiomarina donghaiensis]RUO47446.1 sigma-70 family RNA polymerase sigma factor [Pseudidiomarina donghaiensis]SFV23035.1 RNA polymerase sigma-70 factor, ECF subfamily [Pseudidiomarina donghaiensis]